MPFKIELKAVSAGKVLKCIAEHKAFKSILRIEYGRSSSDGTTTWRCIAVRVDGHDGAKSLPVTKSEKAVSLMGRIKAAMFGSKYNVVQQIGEESVAFVVDEQVVGLDVAMDEPSFLEENKLGIWLLVGHPGSKRIKLQAMLHVSIWGQIAVVRQPWVFGRLDGPNASSELVVHCGLGVAGRDKPLAGMRMEGMRGPSRAGRRERKHGQERKRERKERGLAAREGHWILRGREVLATAIGEDVLRINVTTRLGDRLAHILPESEGFIAGLATTKPGTPARPLTRFDVNTALRVEYGKMFKASCKVNVMKQKAEHLKGMAERIGEMVWGRLGGGK
ncbi:hypothetical protein OF83DRAFT_1086812 [Amylostereum chailletii]|nr:hypothetical protein OF83DRAFT_1086812 [Amylostereum chailletii]